MVDLTKYQTPKTVAAIYEHYVARRKGTSHRMHLGASQIGNECKRALWYQFHWYASPDFEGRILRLFETGDREEDRIVANLRAIGVKVWDRDPETGRQWNYKDHGGHFGLSLDGIGKGFPESDQPHTLEFKTMNDKSFRDTIKKGVQQSKPIYWAQCQIGMLHAEIDRCYFIAVNKNTDEIYGERIKLKTTEAQGLAKKAGEVIFAASPPARMTDDPSFYLCRFCTYKDVCHGETLPEMNCRTCANSQAETNGGWTCLGKLIDENTQRLGCYSHLFNPTAMPWEVHDAGKDFVHYKTASGALVKNEKGNSAAMAAYKGAIDQC